MCYMQRIPILLSRVDCTYLNRPQSTLDHRLPTGLERLSIRVPLRLLNQSLRNTLAVGTDGLGDVGAISNADTPHHSRHIY
jgi:hypothetical protein